MIFKYIKEYPAEIKFHLKIDIFEFIKEIKYFIIYNEKEKKSYIGIKLISFHIKRKESK